MSMDTGVCINHIYPIEHKQAKSALADPLKGQTCC